MTRTVEECEREIANLKRLSLALADRLCLAAEVLGKIAERPEHRSVAAISVGLDAIAVSVEDLRLGVRMLLLTEVTRAGVQANR